MDDYIWIEVFCTDIKRAKSNYIQSILFKKSLGLTGVPIGSSILRRELEIIEISWSAKEVHLVIRQDAISKELAW